MKHSEFSKTPLKRRRRSQVFNAGESYRRQLSELRDNILSTLPLRKNGVEFIGPAGTPVGESHPAARYTDQEILDCLELRLAGMSLGEISIKMEIPKRTLRDIFSGRIRAQHPVEFKKLNFKREK